MAGDPLRKVQSGEKLRIPAEAYNAFIDAVRATRAQQSLGANAQEFARQTTLAKVRNSTGFAKERFSIVGLSQPIVAPSNNEAEFLRQPTFKGVVPTASYAGRFGVLLEPIADGKIGLAAVAGVVPVRLQVNTSIQYEHAEIEAGTTEHLANVPHGSARVLWLEPAGGELRWALVRLDDGDFEAHVYVLSDVPDGHQGKI